ncbi:MAG: hypothetical protein RLZZ453_681 [Chlamydiota bacterium]|jgi:putative sigma-54 modulation protein
MAASKAKFNEDEAQGYRIDVVGRGVEVTDPIRNYIWDKMDKIERFHHHIFHVHVGLEIQKLEHVCTILLKVDHIQIKSHASSTDMYASIDKAIDRLQRLMARYKERIQDHHKKKLSIVDMQVSVLKRDEIEEINEAIEEQNEGSKIFSLPKVLGSETRPLKTLRLDEAVLKLDLSGDQFLLFRSEEDLKLKLLYRRKDGNYGLILPE